jgi:hypothetical protein
MGGVNILVYLVKEIDIFSAQADPKSTIVVIGNSSEYHTACAEARNRGLFIERLHSMQGPQGITRPINANWDCSLKDFLEACNIKGS